MNENASLIYLCTFRTSSNGKRHEMSKGKTVRCCAMMFFLQKLLGKRGKPKFLNYSSRHMTHADGKPCKINIGRLGKPKIKWQLLKLSEIIKWCIDVKN